MSQFFLSLSPLSAERRVRLLNFSEALTIENSRTLGGRHFVDLGEFARDSSAMKFVDCFLGEILSASDVDGFKPTLFSPAPSRAGCHTNLLQPLGQAGYRRCRVCHFLIHLGSELRFIPKRHATASSRFAVVVCAQAGGYGT